MAKRKYSIQHLLSKQPASLKKHHLYPAMVQQLKLNPKLQKVRFTRRCYSLLLHARIKSENLHHFYRTYRLPKDPFFPYWFTIKRDYLEKKKQKREEKTRYIAEHMRKIDSDTLAFIKFLAAYEKHINKKDKIPVWATKLFPSTKKQVHEYSRYTHAQWYSFIQKYLLLLEDRYPRIGTDERERLLACYALQFVPDPARIPKSMTKELQRHYRRLSLLHHPDRGGDHDTFVQLQNALRVLKKEQVQK